MSVSPHVTLICALPSEARPVIEHWRLRKLRDTPFRLYGGEDLRVVVSGVGSHACATAVGFAAALAASRADDIWLNVGIAGHRACALGESVIAQKIVQHDRPGAWYPSLLFDPPCRTGTIATFDHAVTDYPDDAYCDMEAAGFMAAAARVAGGDLVQVLKVVSDNAGSGIGSVDRTRVSALIAGSLGVLSSLVGEMREVARRGPSAMGDADLTELFARWHFSHTERSQLRQLRARHAALAGPAAWPAADTSACVSARAALAIIRAAVDRLPLRAGRLP